MTVTVASFRQDFPEFNSTVNYPSSGITFYLTLAGLLINQNRFGPPAATVTNPPTTIYDMAVELFVAHHVVLEARAQRAAAAGATPGEASGPVSGKSTGPISISYDAGAAVDEKAGHWNDTEYGRRFWQLVRMFGAGPVQLGVGGFPRGPVFNGVPLDGPAWPGFIFQGLGSIN